MDLDDLEPQRKPTKPKDLGGWSVDDLRDYIARLRDEIKRAEAVIDGKQAHLKGAEALFKR